MRCHWKELEGVEIEARMHTAEGKYMKKFWEDCHMLNYTAVLKKLLPLMQLSKKF